MNPGDRVGEWIVLDRIADGGMGAVFTAGHAQIGKRVALKVLHLDQLSQVSLARFLLEARVVNEIGHPNIVDIFDYGVLDDGRPYLVMELVQGEMLSTIIARNDTSPREAVLLLAQACEGLAAAHDHGVVHRDLKPANIMVTEEHRHRRRVKLIDWGIAKVMADQPLHRTITNAGAVIGTASYMAPEQARSLPIDGRADVYSMGVIAYELLLGLQPFERDTVADMLAAQLVTPPPPPRTLWPEIPPVLEQLLLAMLEKVPGRRPTARQVAAALGHIALALSPGASVPVLSPLPPLQPITTSRGQRHARERVDVRDLVGDKTQLEHHRRK
jgi:eukaryotic-like serine/threonine-protein kinase